MQTVPFSPDQASSFAGEVDALYGFLWALTIVVGTLISLSILYFAVKYRRRNEEEIPRPVRASHRLEAVWVGVPFVVAMGIFVWSAGIYYRMYRPPDEAIDVYVVAKQWMWKFQHLDGHREINELHVPVGRKVKLTMTTEDVIHSFFVPALRFKQDTLPGMAIKIHFTANKEGKYEIPCAELCGSLHYNMKSNMLVIPSDEFDQLTAMSEEKFKEQLGALLERYPY